jgi:hypothetical protein
LGITLSGMHEPLPMIFEMIIISPIPFVLRPSFSLWIKFFSYLIE